MKDRRFVYAIGISLFVHLAAICVIGGTSGRGLVSASILPIPKSISVDLVASPNDALKPRPAFVNTHIPNRTIQNIDPTQPYSPETNTSSYQPSNTRPASTTNPSSSYRPVAATPGGKLNIGSTSGQGDLGGLDGGRTPVGYVPGADNGKGVGYGDAKGISAPEPPRNYEEPPAPKPVPVAPKMVSEKVCLESGLLAGPNCNRTDSKSFVDGNQPTRTCNQCKAPEPVHISRIADRANPELIKDKRFTVPGSVDEGLSLVIEVEYTVTADGDVTGVRVTKSSGNRALDKAVQDAASDLKYKPAVQDGTPRSVKMSRTYRINT